MEKSVALFVDKSFALCYNIDMEHRWRLLLNNELKDNRYVGRRAVIFFVVKIFQKKLKKFIKTYWQAVKFVL